MYIERKNLYMGWGRETHLQQRKIFLQVTLNLHELFVYINILNVG